MRTLLIVCCFFLLPGCAGYEIKNLAKSDIDLVADEFIDESRRLVRELMVKLYKRNPAELAKNPGMTVKGRLAQLSVNKGAMVFAELGNRQETQALEVVFDAAYRGDRVFALIVGLGGMLRHAYGYNDELFLFDSLDAEKLQTSAHNVEVLAWRLRNSRWSDGRHFLVASETDGVIDNLSFERLLGKLIVLQEIMARIAGDADDRTVNKVVQAASSVFIPLPI